MSLDRDDRLLTTPEIIRDHVACLPTGNDYVSLPTIRPEDGGVERFGVLHRGCVSLLEVCGPAPASKRPGAESLLAPFLSVDGEEQALAGALGWERVGCWLPRFSWTSPDGSLRLEGTIFAPLGVKGFVYVLRVQRSRGEGALRLSFGLRGQWGDTLQTVFSSARVQGTHRVYRDRWTAGPVFEVRPGPALVGWAVLVRPAPDRCGWAAGSAETSPSQDEELAVAAGTPIRYHFARDVELASGAAAELALYVGVNREGDGARTTAIDLARSGHTALLASTTRWLESRAQALPRLPAAERPRVETVATLNLLFNRFFAFGRCLDTEELACVTSRSPLYYVSAAFWARDSLLWSLPALLRVEPELAREVLLLCYTRHLRNAGVHALYLDGTVLYPGFELDELCAYVVGLGHYLEVTGDAALLAEAPIARGLHQIEEKLLARRHGETWLFETFLYPSDDPAVLPYLTYDTALAARALDLLGDFAERGLWPRSRVATPHRELAGLVRRAIHERLVVDGPFGPMFAWSTDLGDPPRHRLYDEPPGSLQLLWHYGLCSADDPVYQSTRRWIHSPENPYWYGDGRLVETGCPHAEHPFVMSLFNSLLSGREEQAKEILLRAPLDGGLACESFDRDSGEVRTGAAFATCAGFLGYALGRAFG